MKNNISFGSIVDSHSQPSTRPSIISNSSLFTLYQFIHSFPYLSITKSLTPYPWDLLRLLKGSPDTPVLIKLSL